jgi:hypothetical protein
MSPLQKLSEAESGKRIPAVIMMQRPECHGKRFPAFL